MSKISQNQVDKDVNNIAVELTIIIPHYNTPDYLRALLDTIPKEESIQVIVIDDRSELEIEKYQALTNENRYRHITFEKNLSSKKGAGACRNIGLKNATGKWILFADADDYFVEGFYEKLKKYLSCDKDVIFFPCTSVELETGTLANRHEGMNQILSDFLILPSRENELKLRYKIPTPWSKLIYKSVITENDIFFDETLVSNDVMFSVKMGYYMKTFDVSEDEIYCVTNNKGSLTKVLSEENYNIRLEVFIDRCEFLKERLSKYDFKTLDFNGKSYIMLAFKYKLGIKRVIKTICRFRQSRISVIGRVKNLNPANIIRQVKRLYKLHKGEKKYFVYK